MSDQRAVEAASSGSANRHHQILNGLRFWTRKSGYPYSSLDSGRKEFRVVDVLPGDETHKVHCHLRKVSLLDDPLPAYETVSYTWGDSVGLETIRIDEYKTAVPINTAEVLRRFRRPNRLRTLFVDAVCINQNDRHERSGQVTVMGEIYKKCARNLIWLGESDMLQAWSAREAVDDVLADMARETDDFRNVIDTLWRPDGSAKRLSTGFTSNINISALVHVYSRPWFERLWRFQEAVLASASICYLGKVGIPLLKIVRAAIWLNYKWYHLPNNRLLQASKLGAASHMWEYMDHEASYGPKLMFDPRALLQLLKRLNQFRTSEPQDFIFGVLGIHQELNGLQELPLLLQPDYSKTIVEVMRDATIYAIEEMQSFGVLTQLCHRESDQGSSDLYPSWVPKWHRPFSTKLDCVRMHFGRWNTSDHFTLDLHSNLGDLNCLIAPGISYDSVSWMTGIIGWGVLNSHSSMTKLFDEVENMLPDAFKMDGNLQCVASAFFGRLYVFDEPANTETYYGLMELRKYLQQHHKLPPLDSHRSGRSHDYSEKTRKACLALKAVKYHSRNRRFFTTSCGYIGTGPLKMQLGDTVSLLYGSNVPFILRETLRKEWKMVGPCYVHGIMGTEVIQKQRDEGRELESFHIR